MDLRSVSRIPEGGNLYQVLKSLRHLIGILETKYEVTGKTVTLAAGAATTTVVDKTVTGNSMIFLEATTDTAAVERASGNLFISPPSLGQFTINHSNTADTDKTFVYMVINR